MVSKIKAAVDARIDPNMVLVIRTDAIATHGLKEAIHRGQLYAETGADVIFVEAPDRKQMEKIPQNFSKPCLLNVPFPNQNIRVKDIKEMGYKGCTFPTRDTDRHDRRLFKDVQISSQRRKPGQRRHTLQLSGNA